MFPGRMLAVCGFFVATHLFATDAPGVLKEVSPAATEVLRSRDAGIIDSFLVRRGDPVLKDQVVVGLDNSRQVYNFETTRLKMESTADLRMAQAARDERQANFTDASNRHRRRLITDEQLAQAKAQLDSAIARLEQTLMYRDLAKLDHQLAARALEDRLVRSPINGVVTDITKGRGERVTPGDAIVTVTDFSRLRADVPFSKESFSKLAVGDYIPIKNPGDGSVVQALVESITPAAGGKGEKIVRLSFENTGNVGPESLKNFFQLILPAGMKIVPLPAPPATPSPKAPEPDKAPPKKS